MSSDRRHPRHPVPRLPSVKPRLPQAGAFSLLRHEMASRQNMCKPTTVPMPSTRRFPPPWTIEEHNDACFIVRDKNCQALGNLSFLY